MHGFQNSLHRNKLNLQYHLPTNLLKSFWTPQLSTGFNATMTQLILPRQMTWNCSHSLVQLCHFMYTWEAVHVNFSTARFVKAKNQNKIKLEKKKSTKTRNSNPPGAKLTKPKWIWHKYSSADANEIPHSGGMDEITNPDVGPRIKTSCRGIQTFGNYFCQVGELEKSNDMFSGTYAHG